MDEMTHAINRKFGPYTTTELIGTGAQSTVLAATHTGTGKKVALRIMTVTVKEADEAIAECKAVLDETISIKAPNIVRILDYGSIGETLYIAMDNMRGGSLGDRMTRRMSNEEVDESLLPSAADILNMLYRVAEALDTIHGMGMIHGQFSPRSIMFNERGEAFLADIGMSRLMKILYNLETTNSFNMNQYSAPELWEGQRPSPATDQYSLACVIYELLTGKAPFEGTSIYHLMQAHTNDVAAPPHYVRRGLPGDLAMVFWQALAKPVDKRYPTVLAFHDALQEALGQEIGEATDFFTFKLD